MKLSTDVKIFGGIILGTLALIFGAVFWISSTQTVPVKKSDKPIDRNILVDSNSWRMGTESAKVTIVEFSDFQCPGCLSAQPYIKDVLSKYGKDILFVYRYFPLFPNHIFSIDAAVAAEAAGKQGKFWEYHDLLFANQPLDNNSDEFKRPALIEYAKSLGLDEAKFKSDLDNQSLRERVLSDQKVGENIGVNSTPSFFVNGVYLSSGYPSLESVVTDLLKNK